MKAIKRNMPNKEPFSIGSSLDNAQLWSFQKEETKKKRIKIKLPKEHSLVFKKEKRMGKFVSIVGPFFIEDKFMKELCQNMKKKLGSGGTYKESWMEFQGECVDKLKSLIKDEGFRTKK